MDLGVLMDLRIFMDLRVPMDLRELMDLRVPMDLRELMDLFFFLIAIKAEHRGGQHKIF